MPMNWNDTADAKLLVGILATTNVKLDMPALASYMGPGCTVSAVQHRIQRLKEKVGASTAAAASSAPGTPGDGTATMTAPANGPGPASVVPTPEKRKRGRPKKTTTADTVEDSENVAAPTPKKTRARKAKKSETTEREDSPEDVLPDVTHAEALAAGRGEHGSVGGDEVQETPVKSETDVADLAG
ncbi:uncharacterized protein BO80DRAFT_443729 [Aspergillus ibericus CBS 121593]|uniref:AT hook motif protein n=1 Tax=Aspergillus ibericus CBS 121593 TaxID=1448316 RepID=A0A395H661_9EURO|nr:hypothetical protein BO80DRAFT_443729 [Aspergillus ibericus CBS 121593]RAL02418.1 hypothetical protein BO80DRAFT_443729 [Aspergillus ibericus CBS 121593]